MNEERTVKGELPPIEGRQPFQTGDEIPEVARIARSQIGARPITGRVALDDDTIVPTVRLRPGPWNA